MVEIEDNRGNTFLRYKSYKEYSKALQVELKTLQQFSKDEHIKLAFKRVKRFIKTKQIKGEIIQ